MADRVLFRGGLRTRHGIPLPVGCPPRLPNDIYKSKQLYLRMNIGVALAKKLIILLKIVHLLVVSRIARDRPEPRAAHQITLPNQLSVFYDNGAADLVVQSILANENLFFTSTLAMAGVAASCVKSSAMVDLSKLI